MDDLKKANICFDCANAYAHKCKKFENRNFEMVTQCDCFTSDYVATTVKDILTYLECSIRFFNSLSNKGKKRLAKKKGYILYIEYPESNHKRYYLKRLSK